MFDLVIKILYQDTVRVYIIYGEYVTNLSYRLSYFIATIP